MTIEQAASLARFVRAQEQHYDEALRELKQGRKQTHWMWFVLPQLRGLGHSAMAHEYGIGGRQEALSYLAHPVLGPRLTACVEAMLSHRGTRPEEILGETDATKFRSCLTLFAAVSPEHNCFREALDAFYQGQPDGVTLRMLGTV